MSYNPYQYNAEQYASTPTTPGYSNWELEQDPSTSLQQEHSQHQHQPQPQAYVPPTIHVPERVAGPSQGQFRLRDYVHQPSVAQTSEDPQQSSDVLHPPPGSHSGLPLRSAATRERARVAAHPYRRQAESRGPNMREPSDSGSLRLSIPPVIGSSAITMPCPAQGNRTRISGHTAGTTRYAKPSSTAFFTWSSLVHSLRSSVHSPATHQPQRPPVADTPSSEPVRSYIIRADVHYDIGTNILKAMFELPGLKKSEVKIVLTKCPYTRVKQIVVSGTSRSVFPDVGHSVRERRFGRFSRTLVVPPDTTVDKVTVEMEDGILIITVPGPDTPEAPEEPTSIAIP